MSRNIKGKSREQWLAERKAQERKAQAAAILGYWRASSLANGKKEGKETEKKEKKAAGPRKIKEASNE